MEEEEDVLFFLRMVYEMSVWYTDFGGYTCNTFEWSKKYLFDSDYFRQEIADVLFRNIMRGRSAFFREAQLLEFSGHPLKAPKRGDMVRIIHESASASGKIGRSFFVN